MDQRISVTATYLLAAQGDMRVTFGEPAPRAGC
jgi:hypothetical protein